MRKPISTSVLVALTELLLASGLCAQSYSYGTDFVLPDQFPLHNVYVGVENAAELEGVMLPRELDATLGPDWAVRPPGFDVPVGISSFPMEGVGGYPHNSLWAVFGLYTDSGGTEHVVLGTNADLTGVELCSPELLGSSLGCGDDGFRVIEALKSGILHEGEAGGIAGLLINQLLRNGLMLNWGDSSQLFFFSEGAAISGGSVKAVEVPLVPEAPSGLEAKQVGLSDDVEITWQDESNNEAGFRLQYRELPAAPGVWQNLEELNADVTAYPFEDSSFGSWYSFRVAAFNDAGTSAWSNVDEVTVEYKQSPLVFVGGLVGLVIVGWWWWAVRSRRRG